MNIGGYITFVLIGFVIAQIVRAIWYSRFVFGKLWMKANNKDQMLIKMEREKGMKKILAVSVVGSLVATIAVLLYAQTVSYLFWYEAILHGVCITVIFAGASALSNYAYENRSLVSWAIFYGYLSVVVSLQMMLFVFFL